MTAPEIAPMHEDLTFHGPLSPERAARLIDSLQPLAGAHVLDVGCGWAEFLLRVLETEPTATGTGVDLDAAAIAHGQANATARGLTSRVSLRVADVSQWQPARLANVLVVNGATQMWGGDPLQHTANALTAAKVLLRTGGRLLLGEGFWEREPTEEQLAAMPVPRDQYSSLAGLVDLAHTHGYRLLAVEQASLDEWDVFENGHGLAWERWLRQPGLPARHGHPREGGQVPRLPPARVEGHHGPRVPDAAGALANTAENKRVRAGTTGFTAHRLANAHRTPTARAGAACAAFDV